MNKGDNLPKLKREEEKIQEKNNETERTKKDLIKKKLCETHEKNFQGEKQVLNKKIHEEEFFLAEKKNCRKKVFCVKLKNKIQPNFCLARKNFLVKAGKLFCYEI